MRFLEKTLLRDLRFPLLNQRAGKNAAGRLQHLPLTTNQAMTHHTVTAAELASAVRNIPDFPKPGIQFKDITPVLADARLFAGAIDLLTADFVPGSIDAVVGID